MKYTCSVKVPLNRTDCVNLWMDESQFAEWQDGFQSKTWIEGKPNEIGSKSDIVLAQGKRRMELRETILDNNLPEHIEGRYDHIHMTNTQKITFEAMSSDSTLLTSDVEYTAFHSFMPKLMAKLFPGMFKKQSQKWLDQFRELAERNN